MTQTRWDILKDHTVIQKNIDRLFDEAFGNSQRSYKDRTLLGWIPVDERYADENSVEMGWRVTDALHFNKSSDPYNIDPEIKIYQTGSQLIIEITLPELIKETLHIDVNDTILTLRGEQNISVSHTEGRYFPGVSPRRLFRKFFTLPTAPHRGQVTAKVKGGRIKILVKVIKN